MRSDVTIESADIFLYPPKPPSWARRGTVDEWGFIAHLFVENGGEGLHFRFRWVPPGTFFMGSPEDEMERSYDEDRHLVTISEGFWTLDTTVTQHQWQVVMGNNPSKFQGKNLPSTLTDEQRRQLPVEQVSWKDCAAFMKRLNGLAPGLESTFPTEAQWEYAARAGTQTAFWWGDKWDYTMGQCDKHHGEHPLPVKSFTRNPWGLFEVHGNVWEWCADWYVEHLGSDPVADPAGPASGSARVERGGGWFDLAEGCRSAYRSGGSPGGARGDLGFRPVSPGQ